MSRSREDDGGALGEKMKRLAVEWREQLEEAKRSDVAISTNLVELGILP